MIDRERLIQEDYVNTDHGPWKVLVICQCLNRASWPTAEKVVKALFADYPSPISVDVGPLNFSQGTETEDLLYAILRPLGFGIKRVHRLIDMSRAYVEASKVYGSDYDEYPVMDFSGCGQYALDAWWLFVLKKTCRPDDRLLKKYAIRTGLWRDGE